MTMFSLMSDFVKLAIFFYLACAEVTKARHVLLSCGDGGGVSFCLACDEVAKARHRCYFPAAAVAALFFLKALYL